MNLTRNRRIILGLMVLSSPLLVNLTKDKDFQPMFNGKDLTGWYTYVQDLPVNEDPTKVFTFESDGVLHVSGEKFAYIATKEIYKDFHLKLEFKWGEKKYAPRLDQPRDSGICYKVPAGEVDKIWPKSIECQVQEHDLGDLWMIGGATIVVDGVATKPGDYVRSIKKKDAELPNGQWNVVEVIVEGGHCRHIVNGVLVNEGTDASIAEGKILLQSEGAELFYRKVMIKRL